MTTDVAVGVHKLERRLPNRRSDQQITTAWAGLSTGSFKASVAGTDTLAQGISGALGDLVKELFAAAEKAAATAVIELVTA